MVIAIIFFAAELSCEPGGKAILVFKYESGISPEIPACYLNSHTAIPVLVGYL